MALEPIEGVMGQQSGAAGMFQLPVGFDPRKFAAKWVEESGVSYAGQREPLIGTNLTADGWVPWREEANRKNTVVSDGKGRKYVLLCRPAEIQRQVNAAYGNVSKEFINREVTGQTVQGGAKQDAGILTEQQLSGVRSTEGGSPQESTLELNEVEAGGPSATKTT